MNKQPVPITSPNQNASISFCKKNMTHDAPTPATRRTTLATLGAGLAALAAAPAQAAPPPPGEYLDVKSFGAKGDGVTDDTGALAKAIAQGQAESRPVYLPLGNYRLTKPLQLHKQTLIGSPEGAWPGDEDALPVLMVDHQHGPAIEMQPSSAVSGLKIEYRHPDFPEIIQFPPAIIIRGTGVRISNLKISNAWTGIYCDDTLTDRNNGRLNIENVFMVSIHKLGLHVGHTLDKDNLRNIEVWTPPESSPVFSREGVGFKLGKNDGLRMSECFVLGAHIGFLFEENKGDINPGGTLGYLSNCSVDFSDYGMVVRGGSNTFLNVSGGSYWAHTAAVLLTGDGGEVIITGSDLRGNGLASVEATGGDRFILNGCNLTSPHPSFKIPALRLGTVKRVIVSNCIMDSLHSGVEIKKSPENMILAQNMITARPKLHLINVPKDMKQIVLKDNVLIDQSR